MSAGAGGGATGSLQGVAGSPAGGAGTTLGGAVQDASSAGGVASGAGAGGAAATGVTLSTPEAITETSIAKLGTKRAGNSFAPIPALDANRSPEPKLTK